MASRRRVELEHATLSCAHCGVTGPQRVFDSYEKVRRWGVIPGRQDEHHSTLCLACGYATRVATGRGLAGR